MTDLWTLLRPDEREAFFNRDSDRAKAIVLASIVENHLTEVIKRTFLTEEKIWNELFQPSGPLGDFATKIRLAYMAKMIDEPLKNDLLVMSKIRNEFAHKLTVKSFNAQRVRDLIKTMHSYRVILRIRHQKLPDNKYAKVWIKGMKDLKAKALRSMRRTYIECAGHVIHHLIQDIEYRAGAISQQHTAPAPEALPKKF